MSSPTALVWRRAGFGLGILVALILIGWVAGVTLVGNVGTGVAQGVDDRVRDVFAAPDGSVARSIALVLTQLGNAIVLVVFAVGLLWSSRRRHSWQPIVY